MAMAGHLEEFRGGWKALVATALGLGSGMALYPFVINILAPHLVASMGWTKAEFAMASMASGLSILSFPIVGSLADRFGVRLVGSVGVIATTLSYVAIATLDGPIGYYLAILTLQLSLGAMTTGPVFLRLVVNAFDRSRGTALSIAVSTPAIVAALLSSPFSSLIESVGWRTATVCVAIYALTAGLLAITLAPSGFARTSEQRSVPAGSKRAFSKLFENPRYRGLLAVTVLVSTPLILTNSQLALVLIENGVTMRQAGSILALFAFGTIAGRLLAGIALDRFAAEVVGAISLSLPAVGMLMLVSPFDQPALLAAAVLLMGIAFGAEGDVLAYIASRIFGAETYGLALGTLFAAVGASTMVGAFILGQTLDRWGNYTWFLTFASVSVLLGSGLLLFLQKLLPTSLETSMPDVA